VRRGHVGRWVSLSEKGSEKRVARERTTIRRSLSRNINIKQSRDENSHNHQVEERENGGIKVKLSDLKYVQRKGVPRSPDTTESHSATSPTPQQKRRVSRS
jgi:hypothetical protein